MGERVKVGEWWEVHWRTVEAGVHADWYRDREVALDTEAEADAICDERRRFGLDAKVVHVTRYRGKRPACDACGAEIGACPSECDAADHGHGFDPADMGLGDWPDVKLCHGCGAYEEPSMGALWDRIQARRMKKTPPSAGEGGDGRG